MWDLDCEESWVPKNWSFWTVVLEKTLESPLDCKEVQPVHSKGGQSCVFFERNNAKAEDPILWPPHVKSWLIGKDADAGRNRGQEVKVKGQDRTESLRRVQLFATPWTVAYQAPLSMEFSRQEYWSGLPLPSPKADEEGEKYWPRNSYFLQVSYQCNASQLMWILTDVVHNSLWYGAELERVAQ